MSIRFKAEIWIERRNLTLFLKFMAVFTSTVNKSLTTFAQCLSLLTCICIFTRIAKTCSLEKDSLKSCITSHENADQLLQNKIPIPHFPQKGNVQQSLLEVSIDTNNPQRRDC